MHTYVSIWGNDRLELFWYWRTFSFRVYLMERLEEWPCHCLYLVKENIIKWVNHLHARIKRCRSVICWHGTFGERTRSLFCPCASIHLCLRFQVTWSIIARGWVILSEKSPEMRRREREPFIHHLRMGCGLVTDLLSRSLYFSLQFLLYEKTAEITIAGSGE